MKTGYTVALRKNPDLGTGKVLGVGPGGVFVNWGDARQVYQPEDLVVMTECGCQADDYDEGHLTVGGHYHYLDGGCDLEPPYSQGGPA